MTDLRILLVATQIRIPGTGGGETHVSELVAHLREHGALLALTRRGSSGEGVLAAGMWPGLPPRGLSHVLSGANLVRSLGAVRAFAPNVIYERGSSFGLGAMYSRLLGIPLLTMLLDEHMSPLSLRRASRIISTNPMLVPSAFRDKAVKVSWGANTQRFHPGIDGSPARERFGLAADDFVVGYCGTFRPWHGLDLLVDVAQRLPDPKLKFLLVGDPARGKALQQRVQATGLSDRFVFTGNVPYAEVPLALAAADVCAAPFDPRQHGGVGKKLAAPEPQAPAGGGGYTLDPLKVFEYLALQKPVVTIDAENIARLFDDGVHLRMVPALDPDAFARTLQSLRDDPIAAAEMARAGCERVQERHTWRAHAAHLARLFQDMLASPTPT